MPFRFKKSESPAKSVRRVCRERIGSALAHLRQGGRSAAIHEVRREIKKLRAILRLARNGIGGGAYRESVKGLRTAAGYLAAPRDARVMLKAFEKLTGGGKRQFPEIEKALRRHCRRATRRFQKKDFVTVAGRILRKTNRRVGALKIEAAGWAAIEPGLKQSYQRGREFYKSARRLPASENFHAWRKHVKDLWHYFRLLYPAWPAETRAHTDALALLGAQLGEEHDLFLLQQFTTEQCAGRAGELAALNSLIESRQKALRAAALKLGARLYAEAPAVLARRLGGYWSRWHRK